MDGFRYAQPTTDAGYAVFLAYLIGVPPMARKLFVTGIVFCLMFIGIQATGATFETERLI